MSELRWHYHGRLELYVGCRVGRVIKPVYDGAKEGLTIRYANTHAHGIANTLYCNTEKCDTLHLLDGT